MDNCILAVDYMGNALLDNIKTGPTVQIIEQPDASLLVSKPPLHNLSEAAVVSKQGSLKNIHLGEDSDDIEGANILLKNYCATKSETGSRSK